MAWLVPGAGHVFLGRWRRGLVFFSLVLFSFLLGCWLKGHLYVPVADQPLSRLATLGCMGMGLPYFIALWVVDYSGDILASTYEYGKAFILTAGLMNLLVVLDAWDIGSKGKD